jgi:phosphoribosylanthranilate isomerase
MAILVKICGIKTIAAVKTASKAGADFLGLNFVPGSSRFISISQAKKIINALPEKNRPLTVGVFMNQDSKQVKKIISQVKLERLQFHGKESSNFCESFGLPYIKTFGVGKKTPINRLARQMAKYKAEYFLLDRPKQGRGNLIDLIKVKKLAENFPVILAGGLTPKNVKSSIAKAGRISGVDVAGGVEMRGGKDARKVKQFILSAKAPRD